MARLPAKLPAFFKARAVAVAVACVRVPSPSKKAENFLKFEEDDSAGFTSKSSSREIDDFNDDGLTKQKTPSSNRVMVVVDSSLQAKSALQWALSHTVQPQDTIVLLHVSKPSSKQGTNSNPGNDKVREMLHSMKNECQMRRPGVEVEIAVCLGKEKASIIVQEAKERKVSLLVLGQKRRSIMWRLQKLMIWRGKRTNRNSNNMVVEYCIQNANCMTIAVRRKSRRRGGYLITTKRHKKFWLLA
ncbi:OLC1v1011991C1 [Oldenlandia corymbosa var. corymbosa]|uniref:OLC1v1011991C1 n=1 Tax=Oldenlandia corymbosa var. corymbosa TaxID=529605 RepID=A0AAV1DYD7_OLDCO|nr:OLC1v1011991C1 [Oldenlandia corymbosa var. corymbosa]